MHLIWLASSLLIIKNNVCSSPPSCSFILSLPSCVFSAVCILFFLFYRSHVFPLSIPYIFFRSFYSFFSFFFFFFFFNFICVLFSFRFVILEFLRLFSLFILRLVFYPNSYQHRHHHNRYLLISRPLFSIIIICYLYTISHPCALILFYVRTNYILRFPIPMKVSFCQLLSFFFSNERLSIWQFWDRNWIIFYHQTRKISFEILS